MSSPGRGQALRPRAPESTPATPMKKNYVLDANVLLHDPHAIFKFEDNDLIIPIFAIEEIDQFKREGSERGRNARTIARLLDDQRQAQGSTLAKGVPLENGGTLRIAIPEHRPHTLVGLESHSQDLAILQTAIEVRDRDTSRPTIFVTMDTNLRIRADALGVLAETYENQRVKDPELDHCVVEMEVATADVDAFFQHGRVTPPGLATAALLPNACVMLRDASAPSHTALGRHDSVRGEIVALRVGREGIMGARPQNSVGRCPQPGLV